MAYAAFFVDVVVSIFSSRFNASRSLGRCRQPITLRRRGSMWRWCAVTSVRRGPGHRDGRRGMIST